MPVHDPLTARILAAVFKVSSGLAVGCSEKVYENALAHGLTKDGRRVSGLGGCLRVNMGMAKPKIRRLLPGKDWKPVRKEIETGEER